MPRLKLLPIFLFCLVLFLSACGDNEPVIRVDLSKREEISVPAPKNVITYAYLPQYSHAVSLARHGRLVEYLKQTTGLPLLQVFPNSFAEHVKMVERGKIDISFSNPFIYIQLAQNGAQAFARILEKNGKPGFRGQIICRSDASSLQDIKDCQGKRWIAVDPASAGGYLFALGLFAEHGLTSKDFADISFAPGPGGKQEQVVLAVFAGKFDIGSIREGTLAVVGDKIDQNQLRVLASTPMYSSWVFAHRQDLDLKIVKKIAQALFQLSNSTEGRLILQNANLGGVIPAQDADYNSVRDLVTRLGLD